MRRQARKPIIGVLVVVAIALASQRLGWFDETTSSSSIEELFRQRRSGQWVEGSGTVAKVLRDDTSGDKHQQWILRLASGHTLKFAHNIDLAPRIPDLNEGAAIRFRGRYEYNDKGGVIHWTHHDPRNRMTGGWIEHGGNRYE